MKRFANSILGLSLALFFVHALSAQSWVQVHPIGDQSEGEAIQLSDGGFLYTSGDNELVRKVDAFGANEWSYDLSSNYLATAFAIENLPDGNVAVAGAASVAGNPTERYHFIIKFEPGGTILWERLYSIAPPAQLNGIRLTVTDDAFYLGGRFDFLLKADLDGNELWRRTTSQFDPKELAAHPDGGVVMAVNDLSTGDLELRKVSLSGTVEWTKSYGLFIERARSIAATSDGGFIALATQSPNNGAYSTNHYVVKTDGNGDLEWETEIGETDFGEIGKHIIQASDGGYLLAGAKFAFDYAMTTLIKLDASGNVLWEKEHVRGDMVSVNENSDGGFILLGSNWASNSSLLIRTDENGEVFQNTITGRLIDDVNFDCELQIGEVGLEGWEVWATGPLPFANGPFDVIVFTDADGNFSIPVDEGIYEVTIQPPHNGWENCNPPADVEFATSPESADLGNLFMQENPMPTANVSGVLFQDLDGDCEYDAGEPGIPGATMQALNYEGGVSTFYSTLTGADGSYSLDLPLDDDYFVYFAGDPANGYCMRCWDTLILTPLVDDAIFNTGVQCDSEAPQNINGQFYIDENMDCDYAMTEPDFLEWSFRLVKVGSMDTITRTVDDYFQFGPAGSSFNILIDTGMYFMEIISLHPLYQPCQSLLTLDVGTGGIPPLLIPVMVTEECPLLSVDLGTPFLRVCDHSNYYVNFCNEGNLTAEDAYVEITLPPDLSLAGGSVPYSQSGNVATFEIGDVEPGICGSFNFLAFLDCDSEVGETHCVEAHIFPDSTCSTLNAQWDGSDVELTADCIDDQLILTITNAGWGDMGQPIDVLIVEDNVLIRDTTVQLVSGSSEMLMVYPNGATIVMEARQTPGHPSNSLPIVTIEGCGGEEISLGFVNQYVQPYEGYMAIDCRESIAAFDPNIKEAQPKGITDQHYIRPETELTYQVTFQNLGTDTAFEVVILDTLSHFLDTTDLRMGASSHPYEWEILAENILRISFPGIELPHADVNEMGSIGFVKFRLRQMDTNGPGTVIENRAGIYFDFQPPVITNTVTHRIPEPQMFEYQTIELCEGAEYNGQVFTENTTLMDTVRYLFFDSIFVTEIQILPLAESFAEASICNGETYPFGGILLSEPGEYTHIYTGINGCDSTAHLMLEVRPHSSESISAEICEGEVYVFGGNELTEAGEYSEVATAANGCDSTTYLTLSVLPLSTSEIDTLVAPGTVVYEVEVNSDTTFTVIISDAHDCDLELTVNAEILVSSYETIASNIDLEILPNPNNGSFILKAHIPKAFSSTAILRNIYGQQIKPLWQNERMVGHIEKRFELYDLPAGIYFIEWSGEGWRKVVKLMVE